MLPRADRKRVAMKESQPVLMTDQALQNASGKISIVFFRNLFLHQATFNRRLKKLRAVAII